MANITVRETIWQGTIEWTERSKTDGCKIPRNLRANVMANIKDGEVEMCVLI